MKRAVAQLENYLDRIEGHTKGKVVIATVFGDVHDIGKSLVNTILTNNGYTGRRPRQAGPGRDDHQRRDRGEGRRDRALGPAGLDLEADAAVHRRAARARARVPVLIGGAAINRDFRRRVLYPKGKESDEVYEPGVFYCKGRLRRARHGRRAVRRGGARVADREEIRDEADELRNRPVEEDTGPAGHRRLGPLRGRHRQPDPRASRSGACARSTSTSIRSSLPRRHVLFKLHWGGRGKKGESGGRFVEGTTARRASRRSSSGCGRSRTTCARAQAGYSPATPTGNELVIFDPEDHDREVRAARLPRQPATIASAWPTSTAAGLRGAGRRRAAGGDRRLGGDRADHAARGRRRGRRAAVQPHGPRVQAAEGKRRMGCTRGPPRPRDRARPGPPLFLGLSGLPGAVQHEKVERLLAMSEIGIVLSGGHRARAEQSNGGDHRPPPQAVYFG